MNTYKTTSVFGSFVFSKILLPAVGSSLVAIQMGCSGIRNDARATKGGGCRPLYPLCQTNISRFSYAHNTRELNPAQGIARDIRYMDNNNNNNNVPRSLSDQREHNQREHNPNS